jgi:Histidine kinase-, DNA gyrase B-, and HSP90-like ATPase
MTAAPKFRYVMTVDMSVLESLGINLYSNAAAVISELVANAWDADANYVAIEWKNDNQRVVISDDGSGMTPEQINERFLVAGYQKRAIEGFESPKFHRKYMGRKGIGKLSVFSIADTAFVYSVTTKTVDGEEKVFTESGLRIAVSDLRAKIRAKQPYYPTAVPVPPEYRKPGTTIVLRDLKSKRADLTASALRKRIARRFDVLDDRKPEEGGFQILINGTPVTFADREELKRLEYIWEFGGKILAKEVLPPGIERFVFKTDVVNAEKGWRVSGWIGTAKQPTDLKRDDEAGSLRNVIVLARKRPIQEGIIDKLDFSRLFGNYVTGQIEADFLDLDDEDDIATSDRQRLIEDDPRVMALQKFLRDRFLEASDKWTEVRPKRKARDALAKYPLLREWVDSRPAYQRTPAETMIGTVASLDFEGTPAEQRAQRMSLFRSGILAFERVGLRQSVTDLERLVNFSAYDLLDVLAKADSYESGLWVDILRSRVESISHFRSLTSANEKEVVLQKHLFDHLWILDPAWERATLSERMEEDLRRVYPGEFALDSHGKELRGRVDIRYATNSGTHVIVELKRYLRKVDIDELFDQGSKYVLALLQLLEKQGRVSPRVEVVFVLGSKPTVKTGGLKPDEQLIASRLDNINGRYVLYDELIANAQEQYLAYLEASDKARELETLLGSLGDIDLESLGDL